MGIKEQYTSNTNLNLSFKNCIFKKKVSFKRRAFTNAVFDGCTFLENAVFQHCCFLEVANFRNAKFEGTADFGFAKFCEPTIFYLTHFEGLAVFADATLEANLLFTYAKVDKLLVLSRIDTGIVKKKKYWLWKSKVSQYGIDLALTNIFGGIIIIDLELRNYPYVENLLVANNYISAVTDDGRVIPALNQVETFRILKKHLVDNLNYAKASEYKVREKNALRKYLSLQKLFVFERLTLWLNNISSFYGTSYWSSAFYYHYSDAVFVTFSLDTGKYRI